VDAATAVKVVQSNSRVFLHSVAANPRHLVDALAQRVRNGEDLRNVEFCHLHLEGPLAYADPALADHFRGLNFFVGSNQVGARGDGRPAQPASRR